MQARRTLLLMLALSGLGMRCCADDFVLTPWPGPTETATIFPFLIKETYNPPPKPTMRYQQVYSASSFSNVSPTSIYVTTMEFWTAKVFVYGWTVPSIQINLSTTLRGVDALSSVFSDNVGTDDTVVLGPHSYYLPGGWDNSPQLVGFDRPFRYNPASGNLLMDVRVFDGSGMLDPNYPFAALRAYSSTTDEVSRVWATNVAAVRADGVDSTGLKTVIQLSPVPSLRIYTSYFGTPTNYIAIEWPTRPTAFVLQSSSLLGPGAFWQNVGNAGMLSNSLYQGLYFPVTNAPSPRFYRLVWTSGP